MAKASPVHFNWHFCFGVIVSNQDPWVSVKSRTSNKSYLSISMTVSLRAVMSRPEITSFRRWEMFDISSDIMVGVKLYIL